jgi:hypothetical protein
LSLLLGRIRGRRRLIVASSRELFAQFVERSPIDFNPSPTAAGGRPLCPENPIDRAAQQRRISRPPNDRRRFGIVSRAEF